MQMKSRQLNNSASIISLTATGEKTTSDWKHMIPEKETNMKCVIKKLQTGVSVSFIFCLFALMSSAGRLRCEWKQVTFVGVWFDPVHQRWTSARTCRPVEPGTDHQPAELIRQFVPETTDSMFSKNLMKCRLKEQAWASPAPGDEHNLYFNTGLISALSLKMLQSKREVVEL